MIFPEPRHKREALQCYQLGSFSHQGAVTFIIRCACIMAAVHNTLSVVLAKESSFLRLDLHALIAAVLGYAMSTIGHDAEIGMFSIFCRLLNVDASSVLPQANATLCCIQLRIQWYSIASSADQVQSCIQRF